MNCKNCTKDFDPKYSTQLFCCKSCGVRFKNKTYRQSLKAKGPLHRRVRTTYYHDRPCPSCDEIIGKKTRKEQRYCSLKCAGIGRRRFLDIPSCLKDASRKLDKNIGYVRIYVPMHPEANTWGYAYEHRVIAEEKILGRRLRPGEVVHHKNRKRWDNSIDNLEVMTASEHSKHHAREQALLAYK